MSAHPPISGIMRRSNALFLPIKSHMKPVGMHIAIAPRVANDPTNQVIEHTKSKYINY